MLLKIMNEDGLWEMWDGITHIKSCQLAVEVSDPTDDAPPGLRMDMLLPRGQGERLMPVAITDPVDELLIDPDNSSDANLILNKRSRGTFISATMNDGKTKTFAFLNRGYLLSESGKTIESFNK